MPGLIVSPCAVEFRDVNEGEIKSCTINLQNNGSKPCTVRLRPPKDKSFSTRGFAQAQRMAPGFSSSFEVVFDSSKSALKEFVQDQIVVQSDYGDHPITLKVISPQPSLEVHGDLHLGPISVESVAVKCIKVLNIGTAVTDFRMEWDKAMGIEVEPSSGSIAPGGSVEVEVNVKTNHVGALSGDLNILVGTTNTSVHNQRVSFSASVVAPCIELLDSSGVRVKKLDFGLKYFGEVLHRKIDVYNNGPAPLNFILHYGSAGEMRGRGLADEVGSGGGGDDPYAGFLLAARQKVRATATNDNPFSISPQSATLQPFSKATVTVAYSPKGFPTSNGFAFHEGEPEKEMREFDYLTVFEFSGAGSEKTIIPMKGKAMPGGLMVKPSNLDFADVPANLCADHLVTLHNLSPKQPIDFKIDKTSSSYEVEPSYGSLLGGQSMQLHVRYTPKSMGQHASSLTFQGVSQKSKTTVQKVSLSLTGTSLGSPSPKRTLVGGIDKSPKDFIKARAYVDGDLIVASKVALNKKSTKAMTKLWERPAATASFEVIGDGTAVGLSKDEYMEQAANNEKYIAAMRTRRVEAKATRERRMLDDKNVDNGMHARSGLKPFEPEMPKGVVDPLWTLGDASAGRPMLVRKINQKELETLTFHKDRPETDKEICECRAELSAADVALLSVGPKALDFGMISVGSAPVKSILFTNPLQSSIHVVFDVKSNEDFSLSTHNSQVIPPCGKAKFPITLCLREPMEVAKKLEYSVNSMHMFSLPLTASVIPVSLVLSCEDMHFEFGSNNWDAFVEKSLMMNNPHKFAIEFELHTTHETFSVSCASGVLAPLTSLEVVIKWSPPLEGSVSGLMQGHAVLNLLGGEAPIRVFLQGQLPEGALSLVEDHIDAGQVPLGMKQKGHVHIKNSGTRESSYKVLAPPGIELTLKPDKGCMRPDESKDIEVEFMCMEVGPLDFTLKVLVMGRKPMKFPMHAEGVLPIIDLEEPSFDFSCAYVGACSKKPLTLINLSPVPAIVAIDLTQTPELQIELPKDSWSPLEHESCPLVRVGVSELDLDGNLGSGSGMRLSRRDSRRNSTSSVGGLSGPLEGARFHINLLPNRSLNLLLAFRPTEVAPLNLRMTASTLTTSATQHMDPVLRAITGSSVQPRIRLSKTVVNFNLQFVIRSNQSKAPYFTDIYITNADPDDQPVQVDFGEPEYANTNSSSRGSAHTLELARNPKQQLPGGPKGGNEPTNYGVFAVEHPSIEIGVGEMVGTRLTFTPRGVKQYEAKVPIYLNGDRSAPYLQIEVFGIGQDSRLSFDVRECILPPVPLGITSTATFYILNRGFDNLDLTYRLPADSGHVPLSIDFPEGNLIGIAKGRLPVTVSFCSAKPLSFTAKIDFIDEMGRRFSIPISGVSDNSIITLQPFILENRHCLKLSSKEGEAVSLDPASFKMPDSAACLGPLQQSTALRNYLNETTNKGPFHDVPHQMITSRGKLIVELVEALSGKVVPGKISKLPSNKKEAVEALTGMYDQLLTFLKAHGAMLNVVKPEMLLDAEDLDRLLTSRGHTASTPEEENAVDMWDAVEQNFASVSAQAWNNVVQQVFRVFVLGRVNLKSFKTLPGMDLMPKELMPADACMLGSNFYSASESVLLAWMTLHCKREFGDEAHPITNFDDDLSNGLALFSVMSAYWPTLSSHKASLATSPTCEAEYLRNNHFIVKTMADLGLTIKVDPADLTKPKAEEMLVLVAYLYQMLPQLVPKTTIDFYSRLGELAVKELELTNPSKKAISYLTKMDGFRDFSMEVSVVHIDAKSTVRVPVKCIPTTSMPQARSSRQRDIAVLNISGEAMEYEVMCDLDFLSGSETCKTSSKQGSLYKMTVSPPFSGIYMGSISFVAPDGGIVWYTIEIHATEPPELGVIEVTTEVRKAVSIMVNVMNPLEKECEMAVTYSDPSLIGPLSVVLPGSNTEPVAFEFFYSPLITGNSSASVSLSNREIGQFWYKLNLSATPAPAKIVPEVLAEIGARTTTILKVENPLNKRVIVTATSSNPQNFVIKTSQFELGAHASTDVTIEYVPRSIDEEEEAIITFSGPDMGEWCYHCTGRGTLPTCMEMTTLTALLVQAKQGEVVWRNPFPKAVEIEVKLEPLDEVGEKALSLLLRKQPGQVVYKISVPALAEAQIPIMYAPSSLKTANAEVIVTTSPFNVTATTSEGKPLVWHYPIRAVPEVNQMVGSTFEYRCKARSVMEARMEVVLKGIASVDVDDQFTHELIISPDQRGNLGPDVLSITPVETKLLSPNQPLVYAIRFAPLHVFQTELEFVVCKSSGGRWRFEVQLQGLEPDLDGVLTVEAAMDQTGLLPVHLYSSSSEPQPFAASFTANTPLQFDVKPSSGILYPRPPKSSEGCPSSHRGAAALQVTYSCQYFGKVLKGRLVVKTSNMQYSYEVRGRMPEYHPPQPSQFAPTVDSRLAPEMLTKLVEAANPAVGRPNYVSRNVKTGRKTGRRTERMDGNMTP